MSLAVVARLRLRARRLRQVVLEGGSGLVRRSVDRVAGGWSVHHPLLFTPREHVGLLGALWRFLGTCRRLQSIRHRANRERVPHERVRHDLVLAASLGRQVLGLRDGGLALLDRELRGDRWRCGAGGLGALRRRGVHVAAPVGHGRAHAIRNRLGSDLAGRRDGELRLRWLRGGEAALALDPVELLADSVGDDLLGDRGEPAAGWVWDDDDRFAVALGGAPRDLLGLGERDGWQVCGELGDPLLCPLVFLGERFRQGERRRRRAGRLLGPGGPSHLRSAGAHGRRGGTADRS